MKLDRSIGRSTALPQGSKPAHALVQHKSWSHSFSRPDPMSGPFDGRWLWRGGSTRSHPELGSENPLRGWYCRGHPVGEYGAAGLLYDQRPLRAPRSERAFGVPSSFLFSTVQPSSGDAPQRRVNVPRQKPHQALGCASSAREDLVRPPGRGRHRKDLLREAWSQPHAVGLCTPSYRIFTIRIRYADSG